MNKNIAIYFSSPDALDYPLNKKEYFEAYSELTEALKEKGINTYIVRSNSYIKNGKFSKAWQISGNSINNVKGSIQADLIFNRDDKNTIPRIEDCPIINHPDLDELCLDKIKTAELFKEISPKTKSINSFKEYLQHVKKVATKPQDIVVLKKNYGTEGRDIYIRSHQKQQYGPNFFE